MSLKPVPQRPGIGATARRLGAMLRVDHAGELGAVHIYRGQRAVFGAVSSGTEMEARLSEMEAHEAHHLERFDQILTERQIRPTLMAPIWRITGFTLGAVTALMGEKAAHACTEAVETVIEKHYASQIDELADTEPELKAEISHFRDEELAHRNQAIESGAREAPGYPILEAVIQTGCRIAIKISERI